VLVAATLLTSGEFLGLGLETIERALQGGHVVWYAFFLRAVATAVTLSFGGSGGIVTPVFFVGATAGSLFGAVTGLNTDTFAAIGLVSVLAGAANTPIAASIMAVELFGPKVAPYAAVACVISFLMTGHRSVYPAQVLASRKSSSVDVPVGREPEHIDVAIHPRDRTVLGTVIRVHDVIESRIEERHRRNGARQEASTPAGAVKDPSPRG
jgi:hypothetical protein